MNVQTLLAAVMADVQSVAKNDKNTHQNFNFRGIDAVLNAVGPVLRQHKVVVMPTVKDYRFETVEVGQKRSLMGHVIVQVDYTFYGPSGDHLTCSVYGEAMDSGDKAMPKAMSVAFRTALLQALALPTDEPDPDASSYQRSSFDPQDVYRDTELNALIKKAEELGVATSDSVMEFAQKGAAELQASKDRLKKLLADA
jgi:hypothetical protein